MSTNLDQAIDLLTKTDAYELPFASNIIELLGRDAAINGFMSAGAFSEACRNNPISTLLKALQYAVAQFPPSGCVLPGTPGNLSVAAGPSKLTLTWSAAAGATSYNIKSSLVTGGPYITISTDNASPYVDSPLTPFVKLFYVVSAVNACGESANSIESSGTPSLK